MLVCQKAGRRVVSVLLLGWASCVLLVNFLPVRRFPYEVVANGHFVPQNDRRELSRYRGKAVWKEILDITPDVCTLYFNRVHTMFNSAVTGDFTSKMKALMGVGCVV